METLTDADFTTVEDTELGRVRGLAAFFVGGRKVGVKSGKLERRVGSGPRDDSAVLGVGTPTLCWGGPWRMHGQRGADAQRRV